MTDRKLPLLLIVLMVLPAGIAAVVAASGLGGSPTAAIAAIGGLFYALVMLAGISGGFERSAVRPRDPEARRRFARNARALDIPVAEQVFATGRPATAVAVATSTTCPLGLLPNDRWSVSAFGKLDEPLCKPGAGAIERLVRSSAPGAAPQVRCVCPRGRQTVTFALQAP